MEEMKKRAGRPSEGMDYSRETIRLSEQENKTIRKYAQNHGYISTSAAIRGLINQMGLIMKLSDTIEQGIGMLYDVSQVQQSLVDALRDSDEQAACILEESADETRRVAFLFSTLCYEENLPDVKQKQFEFYREGGKLWMKARERKKNNKYSEGRR